MKIQTALLACALAIAAPLAPALAEEAPNYIEDMKRWQPKAEAGDAEAQFQLGQMYALGRGFKQNFNSALEWYEKAAAQGNAKARTALGLLYYYGAGVEQNIDKAGEWFEKAAAQNNATAQYYLETIAHDKKDYTTAKNWAEQSVMQNYAPAMSGMGFFYEMGEGVPQNFNEAKHWYEKGVKQNKLSSLSMLGLFRLYSEGKGVEKDDKQALEWLEKACTYNDFGGALACYLIGDTYWGGALGLQENHHKSYEYSMKAAKGGHPGGAIILKKLKEDSFSFPDTEKEQVSEFIRKADDDNYWSLQSATHALKALQE